MSSKYIFQLAIYHGCPGGTNGVRLSRGLAPGSTAITRLRISGRAATRFTEFTAASYPGPFMPWRGVGSKRELN